MKNKSLQTYLAFVFILLCICSHSKAQLCIVKTKALNVYKSPGNKMPVIRVLSIDQPVTINRKAKIRGWVNISVGNTSGFVQRKHLNCQTVWVCTGEGSYAHHKNKECRALAHCKSQLLLIAESKAEKYERPKPCGYCYSTH